MSTIIVSEKSLAGKRIASILSGGKERTKRTASEFFEFEKDSEQYCTIPLRGHIQELDFPKEYRNWFGTDLKKLNMAPILYLSSERGIEKVLKEKAKNAGLAIIATDADREGESIGFEAVRHLKEANPKIRLKRAYFSAITPQDINKAFSSLQEPDRNFADSADTRREIDLLWGAVLTRYLSLASGRTGKAFLSMGRVQGPVLAIIVNREKERRAFKPVKYWELGIECEKDEKKFSAMHKNAKFLDGEEAKRAFEKIKGEKKAVVKHVRKTKKTLKKPLPFNTTQFLRAATGIGVSAGEAMRTAESLYLQGYTSYPRTDNTKYPGSLDIREKLNEFLESKEFAALAGKVLAQKKIEPSFGKETKDHPPIYPVSVPKREKMNERQWKVYELIARRFLATLSENCETENTSAELLVNREPFIARGQTITKIGWKELYPYSTVKETILPKLGEGDTAKVLKAGKEGKETQPPARYSESALIKIMEEKNLGTKSTRHEIINKLFTRKYIFGSKAIEPNAIAFSVIHALQQHCRTVTEPEMTSNLENEMDEIAAGKKTKSNTVGRSREILDSILDDLLSHRNEIGAELKKGLYSDSIMGPCSKCEGGQLRVLFGRTGKRFLGCTNYPKCTNSYPLPQRGKITWKNENCAECGFPIIGVFGKRGKYEMCLNMECKTKENWGKWKGKKEERKAGSSAAGAKDAGSTGTGAKQKEAVKAKQGVGSKKKGSPKKARGKKK